MKQALTILTTLILIICIGSPFVLAKNEKEFTKTFDAEKKLKLDVVLGNCTMEKSGDKKIHLTVRYTYSDDEFQVKISDRSHSVTVEEKLSNNPDGYANWFLSVPDGVEIEFSSATGGLSVNKVNIELEASSGTGSIEVIKSEGDFELSSGTGRIDVADSKGDFELSSGTGKVDIESSEGSFEASSGTGRVNAINITLTDDAEFSSGTGSVEVVAPKVKEYDLTLSSGTGSATLEIAKNSLNGYFEFSANKRNGRIVCPVKFDGEEIVGGNHNEKIRKWFKKGADSSRYFIKTGTGKAMLKI